MKTGKQLFLFRHAKSAWPDGVGDLERPLAPRGIKAAPKMARFMKKNGVKPDLAVISTAKRTRETWDLVKDHLPDCDTHFDSRLYEAPGDALLSLVQTLDDDARRVMLVGHNPGLQELAFALIRPDGSHALEQLQEKFPTAGLAVLSFDVERWAEISPATAELKLFAAPKMI